MSQTPQQKQAIYRDRVSQGLCIRCGRKHGRQRVLCADCAVIKEINRKQPWERKA